MRNAAVFASCVAVLITLAPACDGGGEDERDAAVDTGPVFDAGSDPDRNEVDADALCERLTTIQCAAEAYCCAKPGRTVEECKTTLLEACTMEAQFDAVAENPITGFDAARAAAAFEEFEALASECDLGVGAWGRSTEGLRAMLQGTVAPKGNCAPDASNNDPLVAAAALASCQNPAQYACQPRATEKDGKPDWTCDARSDVDGPCFTDVNCQEGLYCNNPENRLGAQCRPLKQAGRPCNLAMECESLACEDNVCVAATRESVYCLAED